MTTTQMIARAASKGHNIDEAAARLDELTAAHDGHNLAAALTYWDFATERQALRFAGVA